jgi:hypothetical protein
MGFGARARIRCGEIACCAKPFTLACAGVAPDHIRVWQICVQLLGRRFNSRQPPMGPGGAAKRSTIMGGMIDPSLRRPSRAMRECGSGFDEKAGAAPDVFDSFQADAVDRLC